jgi:hypothetical protein
VEEEPAEVAIGVLGFVELFKFHGEVFKFGGEGAGGLLLIGPVAIG